jgi:hypothetical protein
MGEVVVFAIPERLHLTMEVVQADIRGKSFHGETERIAKTLSQQTASELVIHPAGDIIHAANLKRCVYSSLRSRDGGMFKCRRIDATSRALKGSPAEHDSASDFASDSSVKGFELFSELTKAFNASSSSGNGWKTRLD